MLFIRGGAVGDFILTLPAMQLVRDQLPEVEIEVLGYPGISQLATASGIAAETRSIEYGPLANFFVPGADLDADLTDYFAGFEVVVSYLYDPDGFFHANLERAGVRHLIAASHRVDDRDAGRAPAAAQLAAPLESLALYLERPWVELDFTSPTHEQAAELADRWAGAPARRIALHPGSGSPRKNWSIERWVEVVTQLSAASSDPIVWLIVSGEAEGHHIAEFTARLDAQGLRHHPARDLPLPVLGALLQRCDLFLGHDSGISHLAAACGLPSLLLFGPTRPEVWAPRNPAVRVLQAPEGSLAGLGVRKVLREASTLMAELWETNGDSPRTSEGTGTSGKA